MFVLVPKNGHFEMIDNARFITDSEAAKLPSDYLKYNKLVPVSDYFDIIEEIEMYNGTTVISSMVTSNVR